MTECCGRAENSGTELQKSKQGDAQQEKGCGSIWAGRGVAAKKKKVSELKRVYKLVRFSVAAQLRPKTMAWQRDAVYAFRGLVGCSWLVAFESLP